MHDNDIENDGKSMDIVLMVIQILWFIYESYK